MSESIRVVVADDHPPLREGVITSLASDADIVVVGQAADADGAFQAVREELPDVSMSGGGLQAAARIATTCPGTRIIMLTGSEDEDDLLAAMRAGASGYVLKGVSAAELTARIMDEGPARPV